MKPYQKTPTGRNTAIRRLYASNRWSMKRIADKYGLTKARIHQIIHYKSKVLDKC